MLNRHITSGEQLHFAKELVPHAFDSQQALEHLNKASESLGVNFGHAEMSHTEFIDHLHKLADAGHLEHAAVKKVSDQIKGIDSESTN